MSVKGGSVDAAVKSVQRLLADQQWEGALVALGPLTKRLPTNGRLWAALGECYFRLQRYSEAIAPYRRAAALEPRLGAIRYSLAATLHKDLRFEEAVQEYRRLLTMEPGHQAGRMQLGAALMSLGCFEDATAMLEQCVRSFAPGSSEMRFAKSTLGTCYLQQGDYARGWLMYEERSPWEHFPDAATPVWRGERCERLRIQTEQGFGDTFQFLRFVRLAAARTTHVTLAVQAALVPLLRSSFSRDAGLSHVDVVSADAPSDGRPWVRLMSLPFVLQLGADVAMDAPYISATPDCVPTHLAMPRDGRLRVGLAWQGRASYSMDRLRSLPTEALAPLGQLDGVDFFVLQQDAPPPFSSSSVRVLGPVQDVDGAFVNTAAMISTLDVVVSSDTAIAHLAGALGRPTVLLLAHVSEWRWGHTSARTPWYPQARLFRQQAPGDWASVIAQVGGELDSRRKGFLDP